MLATLLEKVYPKDKSKAKESINIDELKQQIRSSGYETYKDVGDGRTTPKDTLLGTMFVKERMDYGFHIYYIHEPSETNSIAGKEGIVTEMYYDLRNKIYWIKRNMKDVKFSERNVDAIFPHNGQKASEVFEFLSTERNKGLYESALQFLGKMGKEKVNMFGRFFYRLITEHSYFELLYKAGVTIKSVDVVENRNGKSPMEILGLTKTKWKMFSKYNVSIENLQEMYNDEEADNRLINLLAYVRTLEDEYGVEKIASFISIESDYIYGKSVYYNFRSSLSVAKTYGIPEKRLIRYIYFECDVSQGMRANDAISNYRDYVRMCSEMRYERFDRYPKFLKTYHDIVARNYNIKLSELEQQQWDEVCEENSRIKYAADGYRIFTPMQTDELVREGNVLGHCVGSYVGKVRKRQCIIAFLRDADDVDKPLVTIEIAGDTIIQARGKMNNPTTPEQRDIINKFAKKFNLKTRF